ncbi:hypothetical protein NUW54_g9728 [Trametes sanguinea]|uniref:Uncharacterized protein n=1 Tax=Trametes sanguinea TaxID=158606 RepID=A0ACC1P566_9APHY|nr:hypothetical protein NUW54_g9728 [Trametes sanguinea]
MKEQVSHALADLETIDVALGATVKRVDTLEVTVAQMNDQLISITDKLSAPGNEAHARQELPRQRRKVDRGSSADETDSSDSSSDSDAESDAKAAGGAQGGKKKDRRRAKERDNPLHDAVRKCLYSIMGICAGGELPAPIGKGVYWECIPPEVPTVEEAVRGPTEEDSFLE